ncbi:MAG TPA: hypothetical protein VGO78_23220 [Acidimicrobiales bacterium]|nr:hypothetical protein [Acidimicrobiales bacterium]
MLTEDGIAAFDDVAVVCSQLGAACPVGQLALVVDGVVVTAPVISERSYERDQIVVSGEFSRDDAEALADVLAG